MRKTLTLVILVLMVWLACSLTAFRIMSKERELSDVPSFVYYRYCSLNEWLDDMLATYKVSSSKDMMFNGHHILASENMAVIVPDDIKILIMDMLVELGVDTISINIYPNVYNSIPSSYDQIISRIREHGRKLVIVYMVGENTFNHTPTFEEYLALEINHTRMLVSKYKPEFYGIVVEITTMQKRIGRSFTAEQWTKLITQVHKTVKEACNATRTFVSILVEEADRFLDPILKTEIEIIAFNVYSPRAAENVGKYITYAKEKSGKEAWIWENWWGSQWDPLTREPLIWFRDCYWQEINAKWIKLIAYIAQTYGAKMMSPFFTEQFVYCNHEYGKPPEKQFTEILEVDSHGNSQHTLEKVEVEVVKYVRMASHSVKVSELSEVIGIGVDEVSRLYMTW